MSKINKIPLIFVYITLVLMLFITPIPLILGSLLGLTLLIHKRYSYIIVLSFVLSLFIYGASGSLLMHLFHILHVSASFMFIYILLSVPIISLLLFCKSLDKITFTKSDVTHVIFIGVSLAILLAPYVGASNSKSLQVLRLGGSEDSSSQSQMFHYVLKTHTLAYGTNGGEQFSIRASLTSYPQGAHAAGALFTSPFVNESDTYSIVKSYAIYLNTLYVLMFYFLFAFIWAKKSSKNNYNIIEAIVAFCILLIGVLGVFLGLLEHSFLGQIASYVGLIVLVGLTLTYGHRDRLHDSFLASSILILITLLFIFTSWYLIILLSIPAVLYLTYKSYKVFLNNLILMAMVSLPFLAVIAYMTYIYLYTTTSGGHILTPGGVDKINVLSVAIIIPTTTLVYYYIKNRKYTELMIVSTLFISLIFTILIGTYQYIKIAKFEYYFYKSIYTFLLVFGFYILYISKDFLLSAIDKIRANYYTYCVIIILCIITSTLLLQNSVSFNRFYNSKYTVVEQYEPRLLDLALMDNTKYKDVLYIGACDSYLNFLATIWSGTKILNYMPGRSDLEGKLITDDGVTLANLIKEYSTTGNILVYDIGGCDPIAVNALRQYDNITIDSTYVGIQP